jgi:hypothetical protein
VEVTFQIALVKHVRRQKISLARAVTHSMYAGDLSVHHAVCPGQDITDHLTLITVCHMVWAGMDSSFVYKYNHVKTALITSFW